MPEFSAACQTARQAMQAAWAAWNTALDAVRSARIEVREKERAAADAAVPLAAARAAEADADAAWDALIAEVTADPSLGVARVDAGVGPAPVGAGAAAGPFAARAGGRLELWARSEFPDALSAWHAAADRKLQENQRLAVAAAAASAAAAAAQAAKDAADRALTDASFALHNAMLAASQAEAAYQRARDETARACAGQTATSGGGAGPEVLIDPRVLPEDEERVKARLDTIPDGELEGLDDITMRGEPGAPVTYTDANTGEQVDTTQGGTYAGGDIDIYDITGPYAEEVLKHEIGHHVYARLFEHARDAVDEWQRWYESGDNRLLPPRGKMPSGYSSRSAGEGWAECYEMFRDHPERLDAETREKVRAMLERLA